MLTYLEAHKSRIEKQQARHAAAVAAENARTHPDASSQQPSLDATSGAALAASAVAATDATEAEAAALDGLAAAVPFNSSGAAAAGTTASGVADLSADVVAAKLGLGVDADELAAVKDIHLVG